ncbi:hypothetical protein NDU88_006598 [Pleurodeles waltl]|uniref:Uncharacterized protein n=1 Tax=Pleurodeles waltl TaxID=8319 RepID=A0AAV7PK63_PLEWA|nr:hypothetical protein NDU88_006598 [Pleurodeles waltl]
MSHDRQAWDLPLAMFRRYGRKVLRVATKKAECLHNENVAIGIGVRKGGCSEIQVPTSESISKLVPESSTEKSMSRLISQEQLSIDQSVEGWCDLSQREREMDGDEQASSCAALSGSLTENSDNWQVEDRDDQVQAQSRMLLKTILQEL